MTNNSSDVIIFSKDRPWQLEQLLKSMLFYTDFNKIYVLLKMQEPYSRNYNKVIKKYENRVTFYMEQDGFKPSFYNILKACEDYMAFMVDDVVFYDHFSSEEAIKFMKKLPVIAYQFKMNKKYDLCQTAGTNQSKPSSLNRIKNHWIWTDNDGTWDWNYPFDLTGSIYNKYDLAPVLNEIEKSQINNPNDLEIAGASIFQEKGVAFCNKKYMACQEKKVCACLALNHVNPRNNNPWSVSSASGIKYFNDKIFGNYDYDYDYLRNFNQRSVHITKYKLKPTEQREVQYDA